MDKTQRAFLKELVETPSPTGTEEPVAQLVRDHLSAIADEIQTDTMGSVHAILKGNVELEEDDIRALEAADASSGLKTNSEAPYELSTSLISEDDIVLDAPEDAYETEEFIYSRGNAPTLMLSAHMDEVGLMVTYISDDGFCSVAAVGGVDAAILPGMRVDVHTKDGILRGVVGRKPIHLIDADERKTVTPLDKLVIDLGMSGDRVKKHVRIGDSITYGVGFERFGKGMAVSKSFDDRSGVYVACRVMEELYDNRCDATFIAAITVQEEIGTRGAITSAHSVNPDVAIAFDVTHATDYPGIDASKYGKITCGGGPVIARGPNINPFVYERLIAAAEAEGIDYQLEAEPSVTGTDARSIQISQGGIPTGLVSIPLRYMHTPTEVIDLNDLEGAVRLIVRFARDLDSEASFIPGISPDVEHPCADKVNRPAKTDRDRIKELKEQVKALNRKLAEIEKGASIFAAASASSGQELKAQDEDENVTGDNIEDAAEKEDESILKEEKSPAFANNASVSSAVYSSPQTYASYSGAYQTGLGHQGVYRQDMSEGAFYSGNQNPYPAPSTGFQSASYGASSVQNQTPSQYQSMKRAFPASSFAPSMSIQADITPAPSSQAQSVSSSNSLDDRLPHIEDDPEGENSVINILPIIGPAADAGTQNQY